MSDWKCQECGRILPDSPDLPIAVRIHEKSHQPSEKFTHAPTRRRDWADHVSDAIDSVADFMKGIFD